MKKTIRECKNASLAVLPFGFACLLLAITFPVSLNGQVIIEQRGVQIQAMPQGLIRLGGVRPIALEEGEEDDEDEMGATLKTDPDLEQVLERAERFRQDGSFTAAAKLWQIVLQKSGDTLYSRDNKTYYSLVQQVEGIIATLPPEALEAYRVSADANAKEILAAGDGPHDTQALSQVVREYFMSSLGDDAAFDLGCIYLDQYDFNGARRLFEKIIRQYPDPSVPVDQIYTRIGLCHSFLGDEESATAAIKMAEEERGSETRQTSLLRNSLGKLSAGGRNAEIGTYKMVNGNSKRYSVMPALPKEYMDSDLNAIWQYYIAPRETYKNRADIKGNVLVGKDSFDEAKDTVTPDETKLIKSWRDGGWRPAGNLLFDGERVMFKTGSDLIAWDTQKVASGKATKVSDASWRPLWMNAFLKDDATRNLEMIRKSWGRYNDRNGIKLNAGDPATNSEVFYFGDRIHQQMSIHNDVLYSIEGKKYDKTNNVRQPNRSPNWNSPIRRTRSNFLTAYDSKTGEFLWKLPSEEKRDEGGEGENNLLEDGPESPWLQSGGLMSAPIGFGDLVIAPVNQGGAISIYAFDSKNEGKTAWKAFLCDEPVKGSSRWAAIDLSIDGTDLFVSCGMGVVFVLDPATGMVRIAKRYKRAGQTSQAFRNMGWNNPYTVFKGWTRDVIIPNGREMICFCSDTQKIHACDRNSGKEIWSIGTNPFGFEIDYLIGVYDRVLYAAGRETVIAIDLDGEGFMLWGGHQLFDDKQSFGRGMVTPDGVYIPVESGIIQFPLKSEIARPKKLAHVQVNLGTDAPVGNLLSDGKQIWVHGGNRVFLLGPDKTK